MSLMTLRAPALTAVLLVESVCAQVLQRASLDPYTRGDPTALAKAGYVSLGPFPFGRGHDTQALEALFGDEAMAWIETPHFRLGCSLSAIPVKGTEPWSSDWVDRVRAELKRLQKRLPRVNVDTKELDPWLRAHLFAQRLEDLYAEMQQILGVSDASFPAQPGDDPLDAAKFRGLGPYLGMPAKFRLLLVRKKSSLARYTRACHDWEMQDPVRYHDLEGGFLYWGACEETANSLFKEDVVMHANTAFNIAHNLYCGYRSYGHDLPAWLPTGIGHWFSRRVSPRFPTYDRRDEDDKDPRSPFWDWDARAPGLAKHAAFQSLAAFIERSTAGDFDLEQHIQCWSIVDFLIRTKRESVAVYLRRMKEPFHGRQRQPTALEMRQRQHEVVCEVFGVDIAGLEAEWLAHTCKAKKGDTGR